MSGVDADEGQKSLEYNTGNIEATSADNLTAGEQVAKNTEQLPVAPVSIPPPDDAKQVEIKPVSQVEVRGSWFLQEILFAIYQLSECIEKLRCGNFGLGNCR